MKRVALDRSAVFLRPAELITELIQWVRGLQTTPIWAPFSRYLAGSLAEAAELYLHVKGYVAEVYS